MKSNATVSRRDVLFGRLAMLWRGPGGAPTRTSALPATRAVIQGRYCLAYRNLTCSTCRERCPEPGAIVVERGIPRVDPGRCTGCRACHDVCPAPINAVLVVPDRENAHGSPA